MWRSWEGYRQDLAPAIQEEILSLMGNRPEVLTEGMLRRVCAILDWRRQIKLFEKLRGARVQSG